MAYIYNKNIIVGDAGAYLYWLKTTLVTAGWQVRSSSDGTTFNSTGDQITVPGSGTGGFTNTNAWVRIRMPQAQSVFREFTFQRTAATTYTIKYSYAGSFAGGSASTTPTASDQQSLSSTTGNNIINVIANNSDGYGFAIVGHINANVNTAGTNGIVWDPIIPGSGPDDNDPYILGCGSLSSIQASTTFACWFNKGISNEFWGAVNPAGMENNNSSILWPNGSNIDQVSGKHKIGPISWIRPVGSTFTTGYKGTGTMMWWNALRAMEGDTLTVLSSRDRLLSQEVNFPWDGSITLIR